MSSPTPAPAPRIDFAERFSAFAAFAWCAVPSLAGLVAALWLHLGFLLPRLGTGSTDLNRMVACGAHVGTAYRTPAAVAVGDSVTVEGIDASAVAANAPAGWHVENLGINGCDRAEVNVILPRVLSAGPKAVIFVLRPMSIIKPPPISGDAAYAYCLGGFAGQWPPGWLTPASPGLSDDLFERLHASPLRAKVHFRTALGQLFNDSVRERVRRGIKFAKPDDWAAPFNMTASISGKTLDAHLRNLEEEVRDASSAAPGKEGADAGSPGNALDEADMERLIALTHERGAVPVIIASPVHPRLRGAEAFGAVGGRLRTLAPQWASKYNGVYADASDLLDDSGFADGQHLNATGRALLSAFVGKALPPLAP